MIPSKVQFKYLEGVSGHEVKVSRACRKQPEPIRDLLTPL